MFAIHTETKVVTNPPFPSRRSSTTLFVVLRSVEFGMFLSMNTRAESHDSTLSTGLEMPVVSFRPLFSEGPTD